MIRLFFYFCYTASLGILLVPFTAHLNLFFFAPFLILALYHAKRTTCCWLALFCGFIMDLFSGETRIGIYALNYTLVIFLIYPLRQFFFEDKILTFCLISCFFTAAVVLLAPFLFFFFEQTKPPLIIRSYISELIFLCFINTLYTTFVIGLPRLLTLSRSRSKRLFR